MITRETRLTDMSLGDLLDCIDEHLSGHQPQSGKIRGIKGLAEYMQCSIRKAQELKSSGAIDKAILQSGRTIVFDENVLRRILRPL